VVSFYAGRVSPASLSLRAVDVPTVRGELEHYEQFASHAFEWNPDYLIQEQKIGQELIKLGYARNQRLPQLDLKGAYGLNGIGATPGASWDDIQRSHFPSWSIGAEFRMPLGGTKGRHELTAAELAVQSAELSLRGLQTEIFNGLDTARHKVQSLRDSVVSYRSAVDYNQSLLDSALARLQAGKLESRKVFDIESDLFESKNSVVESLVRYEIARLEMEVVTGSLLQNRHLELTQDDLQQTTRRMLKNGTMGVADFLQGLNEQMKYYPAGETIGSTNESSLRDALRRRQNDLDRQP
jgi:outer membrane protein TolC